MRQKLKKCKVCGDEFKPFKTTDKFCSPDCAFSKSTPAKKRKAIKPFSQKKLKDLATYRPLRDEYLINNPICEVHDCNKPTTNLHHKKGRRGPLLYDVKYFMACCETCHPKRIHENPAWAREHGYIL